MNANEPEQSRHRSLRRGLVLALPVLVLIASAVIAMIVFYSRPTAPRAAAKPHQARLVTITPAEAAQRTLKLRANGTVEAADATQLRPRVSGQINALTDKLAPGTRFDKGDVLARIDDADYQLALENARTDLANAKASLRVEQGQQAVAKRELALVGEDVNPDERDLALRGPQLEQAKAAVDSAQVAIKQAKLAVARTAVRAPFNGIVTERNASIGDVVGTADTLAGIAATDTYWADVSLPVDQLHWVHAGGGDQPGSPARIYYPDAWGENAYLDASVLRIQPGLETDGRMARVLLRIPNPLGGGTPDGPRLLIGAYVEAAIQARIPDNSVVIDSAFVHENGQVWVMRDDNTLDIRSVDVAYRDNTQAVITSGLQAGESVVTSELTAPIQGMPLRVETDTPTPTPDSGRTSDTGAGTQSDDS